MQEKCVTLALPGTAAMLSFAASGRATEESNTKQSSLNLLPNVHSINASWLELENNGSKRNVEKLETEIKNNNGVKV